MRKFYEFIRDMAFVYFLFNIFMMVTIFFVRRGIRHFEISFIHISRASVIISFFIAIALLLFKLDKIPTYLRIFLGYIVLFFTSLIIKNLFGPRLFRTSIVLLIFILICTIIYFIILFIVILMNKKEEKWMNEALQKIDEKEEEDI